MQGRKQRDEMLAKRLLRVWVDQADKAGVGRQRDKGTLDCAACESGKQQTDRQADSQMRVERESRSCMVLTKT